MVTFNDLPTEIKISIISYLTVTERLLIAAKIDKAMYAVVHSDYETQFAMCTRKARYKRYCPVASVGYDMQYATPAIIDIIKKSADVRSMPFVYDRGHHQVCTLMSNLTILSSPVNMEFKYLKHLYVSNVSNISDRVTPILQHIADGGFPSLVSLQILLSSNDQHLIPILIKIIHGRNILLECGHMYAYLIKHIAARDPVAAELFAIKKGVPNFHEEQYNYTQSFGFFNQLHSVAGLYDSFTSMDLWFHVAPSGYISLPNLKAMRICGSYHGNIPKCISAPNLQRLSISPDYMHVIDRHIPELRLLHIGEPFLSSELIIHIGEMNVQMCDVSEYLAPRPEEKTLTQACKKFMEPYMSEHGYACHDDKLVYYKPGYKHRHLHPAFPFGAHGCV